MCPGPLGDGAKRSVYDRVWRYWRQRGATRLQGLEFDCAPATFAAGRLPAVRTAECGQIRPPPQKKSPAWRGSCCDVWCGACPASALHDLVHRPDRTALVDVARE